MDSVEREEKFLCELRRLAGDKPIARLNPIQWSKITKELGFSDAEVREVWLRLKEHGLVVQKPASESFALSPDGVDRADSLIACESEAKRTKPRIGF